MTEVKTADLIGPSLDWAVAAAAFGLEPRKLPNDLLGTWYAGEYDGGYNDWAPSTDWAQGGPLIEKYDWALPYRATSRYHIGKYEACTPGGFPRNGDTPLIAACRAIVAAEFGDTVMIPKELMQ